MMTDEEREAHMRDIYRIFGADLDQDEEAHVEEIREATRPVLAWVLLAAAIVLGSLIGLAGCTDTAARDDLAPLTSPRPEPRA